MSIRSKPPRMSVNGCAANWYGNRIMQNYRDVSLLPQRRDSLDDASINARASSVVVISLAVVTMTGYAAACRPPSAPLFLVSP